jgi:hypothetical protein
MTTPNEIWKMVKVKKKKETREGKMYRKELEEKQLSTRLLE